MRRRGSQIEVWASVADLLLVLCIVAGLVAWHQVNSQTAQQEASAAQQRSRATNCESALRVCEAERATCIAKTSDLESELSLCKVQEAQCQAKLVDCTTVAPSQNPLIDSAISKIQSRLETWSLTEFPVDKVRLSIDYEGSLQDFPRNQTCIREDLAENLTNAIKRACAIALEVNREIGVDGAIGIEIVGHTDGTACGRLQGDPTYCGGSPNCNERFSYDRSGGVVERIRNSIRDCDSVRIRPVGLATTTMGEEDLRRTQNPRRVTLSMVPDYALLLETQRRQASDTRASQGASQGE